MNASDGERAAAIPSLDNATCLAMPHAVGWHRLGADTRRWCTMDGASADCASIGFRIPWGSLVWLPGKAGHVYCLACAKAAGHVPPEGT